MVHTNHHPRILLSQIPLFFAHAPFDSSAGHIRISFRTKHCHLSPSTPSLLGVYGYRSVKRQEELSISTLATFRSFTMSSMALPSDVWSMRSMIRLTWVTQLSWARLRYYLQSSQMQPSYGLLKISQEISSGVCPRRIYKPRFGRKRALMFWIVFNKARMCHWSPRRQW